MSKVVSFRLDQTNPREAQALEILNTWIEQGYSIRFSLTNALIALGYPGSEPAILLNCSDLGLVINQINQLLEILRSGKSEASIRPVSEGEPSVLEENFLASIRQAVKSGIKSG